MWNALTTPLDQQKKMPWHNTAVTRQHAMQIRWWTQHRSSSQLTATLSYSQLSSSGAKNWGYFLLPSDCIYLTPWNGLDRVFFIALQLTPRSCRPILDFSRIEIFTGSGVLYTSSDVWSPAVGCCFSGLETFSPLGKNVSQKFLSVWHLLWKIMHIYTRS